MPNRMEEMASKAMGKAKEGKAAASGLTGVFRTLAKQHGEVSALLKRAKSSDDPEKRAELWQEIRVELLSHERGEMREVYPVLRKYPEIRPLAEHHDREAVEGRLRAQQPREAPHAAAAPRPRRSRSTKSITSGTPSRR